jgi:hypothetical protein
MSDLDWKPSAIIMSPEWAFCHSIVSEMPQGNSAAASILKAFRHADHQSQ